LWVAAVVGDLGARMPQAAGQAAAAVVVPVTFHISLMLQVFLRQKLLLLGLAVLLDSLG